MEKEPRPEQVSMRRLYYFYQCLCFVQGHMVQEALRLAFHPSRQI